MSTEPSQLAESSLRLSKKWQFSDMPTRSADALAEDCRMRICKLSAHLSEDGIIPGHIKATLSSGAGTAFFSCTLADVVEITYTTEWIAEATISDWALTVNVISVSNSGRISMAYLEGLFGTIT